MKRFNNLKTKIFTFLMLPLFLATFSLCSDESTNALDISKYGFTFGGWCFDVTTGQIITSYSIAIDTASERFTGSVDGSGKFTISGVPYNADYRVTVTSANYAAFYSTNSDTDDIIYDTQFSDPDDFHEDHPFNRWEINLQYIPLVPALVTSPAVTINVLDQETGAALTVGGYYKLVRGAVVTTVTNIGAVSPGAAWAQDANVIGGIIPADGIIQIAAGALIYGYQYSIMVFGVPGYLDLNNTAAYDPTTYNPNTGFDISLQPNNDLAAVSLVAVNVLDANNVPIALNAGRTVVFTFNQNIELLSNWDVQTPNPIDYLDGTVFLAMGSTANTDNDANVDTFPTTESVAAKTSTTTWLSAAATGNQLTITLAADTIIFTGQGAPTYDADDDLTYTLQGMDNFMIRATSGSAASADSGAPLGGAGGLLAPFTGTANDNALDIVVRQTN